MRIFYSLAMNNHLSLRENLYEIYIYRLVIFIKILILKQLFRKENREAKGILLRAFITEFLIAITKNLRQLI